MKLEYIYHITPIKEKTYLHVYIHTNLKEHSNFLKSYHLTKSNVDTKIINNGNRLMIHYFDKNLKYFSIKELVTALSNVKDDLIIDLTHLENPNDKLMMAQLICKGLYTFEKYKTKNPKEQRQRHICFYDHKRNQALMKDIIHQIYVTNMNRDFQNEPANIINPKSFCDYVKKKVIKNQKNIKVKVFDEKDLKAMGLNMIEQMGKASIHKSRFLVLEYMSQVQSNQIETFAIVGKGVCFDSGGLNIKTDSYMDPAMKADKTGGTTAVSVVLYAAQAKLKCNVIALVPLIENIISGDALHPGDIVKTYNKKTVEIIDTDAEGRVIMTDALAYTSNYPKITYLFDLATLTGQAETFVPDTTSVHFTLNKQLSSLIEDLGEKIGERTLALPAHAEYTKATFSDVADYKNYDFGSFNRTGTYMASVYLLNFVPKHLRKSYVHFDITNSFPKTISNGNVTILILSLIKYIIKNK